MQEHMFGAQIMCDMFYIACVLMKLIESMKHA